MLAVTTFPEWAWDVYAGECIESLAQNWPGSVIVYYEGGTPPSHRSRAEFRPLDFPERDYFLELDIPEYHGVNSFLFDAKRFCHKAFVQLATMEKHDRFWWIDADVEAKKPIPKELIETLTSESFVTFLGRDSYTETGVIGFNGQHPDFDDFEARYTECYFDGGLFKLPHWTDCHAFDYARNGGGFNLTPDGHGFDNVLQDSVLGDYLIHHKGNRKFRRSA